MLQLAFARRPTGSAKDAYARHAKGQRALRSRSHGDSPQVVGAARLPLKLALLGDRLPRVLRVFTRRNARTAPRCAAGCFLLLASAHNICDLINAAEWAALCARLATGRVWHERNAPRTCIARGHTRTKCASVLAKQLLTFHTSRQSQMWHTPTQWPSPWPGRWP